MGSRVGIIQKPKDIKKSLKRLLKYLLNYKFKILLIIICSIFSAIFFVVGPKILGNITTLIFEGIMNKIYLENVGIDFDKIKHIVRTLIFLYSVSLVFSLIQFITIADITNKIAYNLRREISKKIDKLEISYFEVRNRGEILSTIINDVDTLSTNLSQGLSQFISGIFTVIGILYMMFGINIMLSFISLLLLPLSFFIIKFVVNFSQKYFISQQSNIANINSSIEESFSGFNVVKAYNLEEKFIYKFEELNNKLKISTLKSQFFSSINMPILNFINNLAYAIITIFGAYLTFQKVITIGDMQAFLQYIRNYATPIGQMAQIIGNFQGALAASDRIFSLLDEEEKPKLGLELLNKDVYGNIEFKNVDFGYTDDKILNQFNLTIKGGQKIAIVGPTGAGKSTIMKLIMRFYDINSGDILIDGNSIYNYDIDNYRNLFAFVLQDTWLFSGTIKDNIKFSKFDASDDEILEISKLSYVDEFVKEELNGYDTELDEDISNISDGQKQLLTIARAMLKKASILILDEATSFVDTNTEIKIQNALDELMKNKTTFIIAHRLSTIQNADIILCLKDGKIIEQGNHNELLNKKGYYFELYNSQFMNII